ncbi:excisionase family DNA-binding protein [Halobacillus seohaensis]|uniref:Excisionase family DNA-binding protein n=1 Tax=Halobacillus seohaensis TaxID=447421 RepID=A0ABW2EJY2_9BACI
MYITIKETADYLDVPEAYVENLIRESKIRTIHDGEQYLINQSQFDTYFKQIENYRAMIQDYLNDPIPKDLDINDED